MSSVDFHVFFVFIFKVCLLVSKKFLVIYPGGIILLVHNGIQSCKGTVQSEEDTSSLAEKTLETSTISNNIYCCTVQVWQIQQLPPNLPKTLIPNFLPIFQIKHKEKAKNIKNTHVFFVTGKIPVSQEHSTKSSDNNTKFSFPSHITFIIIPDQIHQIRT